MRTRKRLRLSGYDYRLPNAYFVTICCDRRRHLFGHISSGVMHRNSNGEFAHNQWLALADAYPHIDLGEFVIMPNHMHGVIYMAEWDDGIIDSAGGGGLAGEGKPLPCKGAPTLSAIIGAYKSLTYRDCLTLAKANDERLGKLWQRSYHENIIRTPEAARRIRHYIRNNVRAWARDKFYGG